MFLQFFTKDTCSRTHIKNFTSLHEFYQGVDVFLRDDRKTVTFDELATIQESNRGTIDLPVVVILNRLEVLQFGWTETCVGELVHWETSLKQMASIMTTEAFGCCHGISLIENVSGNQTLVKETTDIVDSAQGIDFMLQNLHFNTFKR